MIFLGISGQNLTIKALAGAAERESKEKILNLKVTKMPIRKAGTFVYYEVAKSAIDLIYKTWKKDEILVDKKAQPLIDSYLFSKIPLAELPKEKLTIFPLDPKIQLKPHQVKFASYSFSKGNIIIFDPTGSGKAISMITRVVNSGFNRLLIVSTLNNVDDWSRDLRSCIAIDPVVYGGKTPKQREKIDLKSAKVVFTNYEQLKHLNNSIVDPDFFDAIILDEVHNGTEPSSKTFKLIHTLLKKNKNRRNTIGSTATPFDGDNLKSLWGLLDLIDPIAAGKKEDFIKEYQEVCKWQKVELEDGREYKRPIKWKTKNTEQLSKLLSTIAHKSDISAEFKFKDTSDIIPLEMTTKQREVYDRTIEEYEYQLSKGTFYTDNPLAKCSKLFQIAEYYKDGDDNVYSSKHDWCVDYFNGLKKSGESAVFWSAFVEPTEAMWNKFRDCSVLYSGSRSALYKKLAKIAFTGAKDSTELEFFYENCDKVKDFPFREPKSAQFMFAVGARRSSEGLNLPEADRQIVSSVNLSGRVSQQMIGRIKRLNSEHDEIFTKYLAITNSVDIKYISMVLDKIKKVSDILDGKESKMASKAKEIVDLFHSKTRKKPTWDDL